MNTISVRSGIGYDQEDIQEIMDNMKDFQDQITDYIFVEHEPALADIIFIPGNGYPQMSERAAELYRAGYAPYILPSGRYSVTTGTFSGVLEKRSEYPGDYSTEWQFMQDVLVKKGVPRQVIFREDHAGFTYENAIYSRQVTDQAGLDIRTAILCCKSFHARRCLLYYQLLYPDTKIRVCPSDTENITHHNWTESEQGIDAVMGELTRILKQFNLML